MQNESPSDQRGNQIGSRPVPDPTVLTTEQLHREIGALNQLVAVQLEGLEEIFNERFHSVDQQLELVERQRVEQKADTKAAVDAALTAQKEAVREQTNASDRAIAKSEASMTKQIEQLGTTFTTAIGSITANLNDVKERVQAVENKGTGAAEIKSEQRASNNNIGVIVAIVAAIFAGGSAIYLSTSRTAPVVQPVIVTQPTP